MGCCPVLRAGDALYRPLVAALGDQEPHKTDPSERGFRYRRPHGRFGFMGCRWKNGVLFGLGHLLRHSPMADVQRLV